MFIRKSVRGQKFKDNKAKFLDESHLPIWTLLVLV